MCAVGVLHNTPGRAGDVFDTQRAFIYTRAGIISPPEKPATPGRNWVLVGKMAQAKCSDRRSSHWISSF